MSCLFKDRVVFWSNKKQIQSFLNVKIKKANSPAALTKRYIPSWFGYTTHHVDKSVTNLNEISKKTKNQGDRYSDRWLCAKPEGTLCFVCIMHGFIVFNICHRFLSLSSSLFSFVSIISDKFSGHLRVNVIFWTKSINRILIWKFQILLIIIIKTKTFN